MSNDDTGKIIEYFDDKFAKLLEGIDTSIEKKVRNIVREELEPVKTDITIIKKAVTATNQDAQDLKVRVADLEAV